MKQPGENVFSRRSWLRMLLASGVAGAGLDRLCADDGFHAGKAALLKAAAGPGPARDKLLAQRLRHPAVPLPFNLDSIPGFSRSAHEVHFSHHYLEYLWRWENGERLMLTHAAELSELARNGASDNAISSKRQALLDEVEQVRQSANMVMLHNSYWTGFSTGDAARKPDAQALANQLPGTQHGDQLAWLVLLGPIRRITWYRNAFKDRDVPAAIDEQKPYIAEGLHHVATMDSSFPFSYAAFAAIDCLDHSWVLDFDSFQAYLLQVLLNSNPASWRRWKRLLDPPLPDDDTGQRELHPVMNPTMQIGTSESQIRQRNSTLAVAATERPVAEQMNGPEDRVRAKIEVIAKELGAGFTAEPAAILYGLRLAAGADGHVAIAFPMMYETLEVMLVNPERPSGLVDSVLVSGVPGLSVGQRVQSQ